MHGTKHTHTDAAGGADSESRRGRIRLPLRPSNAMDALVLQHYAELPLTARSGWLRTVLISGLTALVHSNHPDYQIPGLRDLLPSAQSKS